VALRQQLEDLPDGGVFAISIPKVPYRCPPGPYERACMVASYFKTAKPRAKVLVLDANPEVQSKKALFERPLPALRGHPRVPAQRRAQGSGQRQLRPAKLEFEDVKADVLNVMPPQRAGDIARTAGLVNINNRWVGVNWLTMESHGRARHPCAGRRHLPGAADAQERPHGQPARQGGGGGHHPAAARASR
jgi:sulfide dehydrogenase [flavocytochrome c] flavoprotein subunit